MRTPSAGHGIPFALALAVLGLTFLSAPQGVSAQEPPVAEAEAETAVAVGEVDEAQIETLAHAYLEISEIRDQLHQDLARWHEDHRREEAREDADQRIEAALERHGLTATEYAELTQFVSVDQGWREAFEEAVDRVRSGT